MLTGGLARDRLYLFEGNPGAGKTTIARQFLLEGVLRGTPTYVGRAGELTPLSRDDEW